MASSLWWGNSSGEEARRHLYRRIYALVWVRVQYVYSACLFVLVKRLKQYALQYASGKIIGKREGVSHPTYVYPKNPKVLVRARFPSGVKSHADLTGPTVRSKPGFVILSIKIVMNMFSLLHTGTQGHLRRAGLDKVAK